jgi:phage gpG-like protein
MNTAKVIDLLESLLKEVKGSACVAATPVKKGNRTPPRTDYRGGNAVQDLTDVVRRAVRLARNGKMLSKKERNLARKVVKDAKKRHAIVNTNGVDVFTHAGL